MNDIDENYKERMAVYEQQLLEDIANEQDTIKHCKRSIELSQKRIDLANEALAKMTVA